MCHILIDHKEVGAGIVCSVALAQHPHAVVVDTRTKRAFVTCYGAAPAGLPAPLYVAPGGL